MQMQRAVSTGAESGGSGSGVSASSRTLLPKPGTGLPSSNSFTATSAAEAASAAESARAPRRAPPPEHAAAASFDRGPGSFAARQSAERRTNTGGGGGTGGNGGNGGGFGTSTSSTASTGSTGARDNAAAGGGGSTGGAQDGPPRPAPGTMHRQISDDFRKAARKAEFEPRTSERLERNMARVHAAMEADSMAAFGQNKEKVLRGIDEIRKRQMDVFRHQMHLEFSLSMDDNEEDVMDPEQKIFSSEGFSEEFQEKFKKKERVRDDIHGMLEQLTKQLQEVNAAGVVAHMPVDPSYTEPKHSDAAATGDGGDGFEPNWNVDFA
ncbi:Hypothetical Protein FCC1311_051402 [Hondaea fermentalgiana]|uniref:Uncharacterized protein n=1 Tax=Hondaea fermentalgiana TaxID=2315210 RepID=A0A2R5GF28_9STRA|nr:Hypothetical Protein FCC1311_051402 [Hondaea fermentalgiana]|eukprot:GBG28919.1 Hypothetical Protein FCC1311_051402 [Hondaea fermentalgiana]